MKSLIKSGLRRVGYEIRRHVEPVSELPVALRGLKTVCGRHADLTLFDVGAHHGETENLLRGLFPAAAIHCFEPFPKSFEVLKTKISGKSYAHNFGFAETAGNKTFQSNVWDGTNSLLQFEACAAATWERKELWSVEQVDCRFETVDLFMQANAIGKIDLLKMDTQGSEYLVLEGAREALASRSIKNVFLEIITVPTYAGQKQLAFYADFFERAGFRLFGLYDNWHKADGELLQLDALFTLKEETVAFQSESQPAR
jgi:FkbM family methyltransferase